MIQRACFAAVLLLSVLFLSAVAPAGEKAVGKVSGRLFLKEGVPLANAVVHFFGAASGPPPSSDKYWRIPDEVSTTGSDGSFAAELAPGKYFLAALKRKDASRSQEIGPPLDGDYYLKYSDAKGELKLFLVEKDKTTALGDVTGAFPFKPRTMQTGTAIAGKISDENGVAVENALVFAFLSPARGARPLFVSQRTGKDGSYLLRVHQGGRYYVKFRNLYGGAIKKGETVGSYGGDNPVAVMVEDGTVLQGIDMTGSKFPGRGSNKLEFKGNSPRERYEKAD